MNGPEVLRGMLGAAATGAMLWLGGYARGRQYEREVQEGIAANTNVPDDPETPVYDPDTDAVDPLGPRPA